MHWKIKGVVQGILSRVPCGSRVNDWLQVTLGERRGIATHVERKVVDDWCVHVDNLRLHGAPISGNVVMELGTGWLPVLPLCFALAGARRCHTFDLERKLDFENGAATLLPLLEPHLERIAGTAGAKLADVRGRFEDFRAAPGTAALLSRANIVYHAPADATRTELPDASVDIYFSNSVLEHVAAGVLDGLMREAARVISRGGFISHSINCGDHYAYFDRGISKLNYLKFSASQWRRWNNDLLYQNRLRPSDFVASAERSGLRIVARYWHPDEQLLVRLPESEIAEEFRRYSREDLAATSVDLICAAA